MFSLLSVYTERFDLLYFRGNFRSFISEPLQNAQFILVLPYIEKNKRWGFFACVGVFLFVCLSLILDSFDMLVDIYIYLFYFGQG